MRIEIPEYPAPFPPLEVRNNTRKQSSAGVEGATRTFKML